MFYKSPGRTLRDLRGINTGHYGKKWSIMKKMAPNFNDVNLFPDLRQIHIKIINLSPLSE
jgi:hypothetical protein